MWCRLCTSKLCMYVLIEVNFKMAKRIRSTGHQNINRSTHNGLVNNTNTIKLLMTVPNAITLRKISKLIRTSGTKMSSTRSNQRVGERRLIYFFVNSILTINFLLWEVWCVVLLRNALRIKRWKETWRKHQPQWAHRIFKTKGRKKKTTNWN